MTPEQFCYWFQGFAELSDVVPNQTQWDMMRRHVASVFENKTGQMSLDEMARRSLIGPGLTGPVTKVPGYQNDFNNLQGRTTLVC